MRYFRRFIWFFAFRLLALCLILGLLIMAFYLSMNASNIYVILKDGLSYRARVIMMGEPENKLNDFFSASFLATDEALSLARSGNSPYQLYYTVSGFDHRLELGSVWCWPWDSTARATIVERIPAIDGRLNSSGKEWAEAIGLNTTPPAWSTGRYQAVLTQENGHWRIKTLTLLEVLNE